MELLIEHLGKGFWITLALSLPCVLTAALVGLIIGILQAVTQVQEQTIAAAPKIVFVFLVLIFGGGLMMGLMEDYLRESVNIAFNEIPQNGVFVLPPKVAEPSQARAKAFFKARVGEGGLGDRLKSYAGLSTDASESTKTSLEVVPGRLGGKNSLSVSEQMVLQNKQNKGH